MSRAIGAPDPVRSLIDAARQYGLSPRSAIMAICLFGLLYGGVMGSWGGLDRLLQIAFSAVKVPILLLVTLVICIPSFFVINTLLGLRDDFREAMRAILTSQATLAIVLASLAPYTAVWYISYTDRYVAIFFNAAMFGTASLVAQFVLYRFYRPLIARNAKHRIMVWFWLAQYAFVGVQLAWNLRPYVGARDLPTTFFREDGWSNAWVELVRMADVLIG